MPTVILGGGIAGRLAGSMWRGSLVLEGKSESQATKLTRFWGTNYLWQPLEGFQCRSFPVITEVDGAPATEESILAYKRKVKKDEEDRTTWGLQFQHESIGYDLVDLPECNIRYDQKVIAVDLLRRCVTTEMAMTYPYDLLISTIPLPSLLVLTGILDYHEADRLFVSNPIHIALRSVTPRVWECYRRASSGIYVNYVSDPADQTYRYCVREGKEHRESLYPYLTKDFEIRPGKIYPSSASVPLLRHLRKHGVYCFGRFASWQPNELVHETHEKLQQFYHGGHYDAVA